MAPKVTWLGSASDKVDARLTHGFTTEIQRIFPSAIMVTVYDCFGGYSQNHEEKVVLGVEVRGKNTYHTHILKIGDRKKAARDYDGWRKCVLQHNFASRILVSLAKKDLPGGRVGIIYEDAYRFFGSPEEGRARRHSKLLHSGLSSTTNPIPLPSNGSSARSTRTCTAGSIAPPAPRLLLPRASTAPDCAVRWTNGRPNRGAVSCDEI